jgi:hypothetical protein
MTFSVALDWLSFTLKGAPDENKSVLHEIAPLATRQPATPRFGYDVGFAYETGILSYYNTLRFEMGIHVIVPGSALRVLESRGISTRQILSNVVKAHGKVTRLDLAKDAIDENIQLATIAKLAIDGKRTGSAQSVSQITSSGGGQTIYVGSRSSDRFARMYDKAAQQGLDDDWKRLEIECKGDVAKTLARVLVMPDTDWNATIGGIMQKMLMVDEDSYRRWLDGASVDGLPKIEKQTDREAWLLTQVLPAISEHIKRNGQTAATEAIYNLLRQSWSE